MSDQEQPSGCDHYVGWVHRQDLPSREHFAASLLRPGLVHASDVANIVSAYRAELAQRGASYRETYSVSDEMVFALAAYHFRYCPLCGIQLHPFVR